MSGEITITVNGNLTADPELRFTPAGQAVANFTIAQTPRTFDRQANEWKDGETLFLRCSIWREAAENVAASLTKGMGVIASGRLKSRTYQTKEGDNRTVMEFEVDDIGPSLKYAQARVQRVAKTQGGQQGNGNDYNAAQGQRQQQGGFGGGQQAQGGFGGQQQQGGGFGGGQQRQQGGQQQRQQPPAQRGGYGQVDPAQAAAAEDPWATPGVSNAGGWGTGPDSEPPF